jgi:hypothetical protein
MIFVKGKNPSGRGGQGHPDHRILRSRLGLCYALSMNDADSQGVPNRTIVFDLVSKN